MFIKILLYTLFFLLFIVLLVILIPLKLEICYKTEDESKADELTKEINKKLRDNYLKIYILYFIPLPKIKLQVKKNSKLLENKNITKNIINTIFSLGMELIGMNKTTEALINKNDVNTIKESLYFESLNVDFGYNFFSVLTNAYVIAFLSSVISLYTAKNVKMFNLKKYKYNTYISNNQIYNLNFFSIVKFKLANTIDIFIKIFIKLRKVVKNNGKGNASNRRFNDDCYDIS